MAWKLISARSRDAFAPFLRPSYESLEAEASTVSAIESRYQTPLLGAHAGFVRSCSYGCKEAAWEADPECHQRQCGARRSRAVPFTPLRASCPSALYLGRLAALLGEWHLRTAPRF